MNLLNILLTIIDEWWYAFLLSIVGLMVIFTIILAPSPNKEKELHEKFLIPCVGIAKLKDYNVPEDAEYIEKVIKNNKAINKIKIYISYKLEDKRKNARLRYYEDNLDSCIREVKNTTNF